MIALHNVHCFHKDVPFKRHTHGHHKPLTLTQQLDNMKQLGVNNFLRNVATASISDQHSASTHVKKSHGHILRGSLFMYFICMINTI